MPTKLVEATQAIVDMLTPIAEVGEDVDSWKYFLAAGLSFCYLDNREEVHTIVLSRTQSELGCKHSPQVKFSIQEMGEVAARVVNGIQKMEVDPIDFANALVLHVILMAREYEKNMGINPDLCWSAFKIGIESQALFEVNTMTIYDPDTLEEILKVEPQSPSFQKIKAQYS